MLRRWIFFGLERVSLFIPVRRFEVDEVFDIHIDRFVEMGNGLFGSLQTLCDRRPHFGQRDDLLCQAVADEHSRGGVRPVPPLTPVAGRVAR